jgi:multidrug efflux pump subunit AcrA (membrane-fusion protein)
MGLTKLRTAVTVLVLFAVLGAAAGGLAYHGLAEEPGKPGGGAATANDLSPDEPEELVKVPSRVDGVLVLVGTEIKEGEKIPPGRVVTVKVGGEEKKYRRLRVGDRVEEGQLLARLDDRVARDELAIKREKITAAEADWKASAKTRDETEQRYRALERRRTGNPTGMPFSAEDLRAAKLTWDRYSFEEVAKKAALEVAKVEERLAQTQLSLYEIRSPARGVITKVAKHAGEGVRAYETVFQILSGGERDD